MKYLALLPALIGALFGTNSKGETVIPLRTGDFWGVELRDVPFPQEELRKELKSGLTTTSIIEVVLKKNHQEVQKNRAVMTQFFQLWEERYQIEVESAFGKKQLTFKQIDPLIAHLKKMQFPKMGKWQNMSEKEPYQIKVKYLLNPIDKTKSEKIRKWISANRASSFGAAQTAGAAATPGVRFNRLFNSILDEYFSEEGQSAKWEFSLETSPFTAKEMKRADDN